MPSCRPAIRPTAAAATPQHLTTTTLVTRVSRRKFVPGCYALSVQGDLPQHIEDILDNRGIKWRLPD